MKEFVIKYWLEVIFSIIISCLSYIINKMLKKINEQESLKLGLQALLRDRIIESYNKYLQLGYCPIYARDTIEELANQYYNLGGNGVIHQIMDKLNELPINKED